MTAIYDRKERAFFGACAYLGALFMSCVILWWSALAGGNPLSFSDTQVVDERGQPISILHVGQAVGVRRHICSTQEVGVEFFPALRDAAGLLYPLPSGMIEAQKSCATRTYGFVVPDIPPGVYVYQSAIRYQSNLVGRDEMTSSPAVTVRVE